MSMFHQKRNEFRIPYDPMQIENLYHYLKAEAKGGVKRYYAITVDNLPVVNKTNNLGLFSQYQRFVHPGTQEITVLVYSAKESSPWHKKHIFFCRAAQELSSAEPSRENSSPVQSLNGVEIQQLVEQRLSQEVERLEKEQLKRELETAKQKWNEEKEQAKKQLDEAEEYALELADKLEEVNLLWKQSREELAKVKESKTYDLISGLAGVIPSIIPEAGPIVSGALSGMSGGRKQNVQTPETEASFSKKQEETAMDEKTRQRLEFLGQLENTFNQNELNLVMDILNRFIDEPQQLTLVAELLNIPINK